MTDPTQIYRRMMMSNFYPSRDETLALVKQLIAAKAVIEAVKVAKMGSYVREQLERYEDECRC